MELEFQNGKAPTVTLYRDGIQVGDPISLSHLDKRQDVHDFFQNLGFEKKSKDEIAKVNEQYSKEYRQQQKNQQNFLTWSRTESWHQMRADIDDFRKTIMNQEEYRYSPRFKRTDVLEINYRTIFGTTYLTFKEKVQKAEKFLSERAQSNQNQSIEL